MKDRKFEGIGEILIFFCVIGGFFALLGLGDKKTEKENILLSQLKTLIRDNFYLTTENKPLSQSLSYPIIVCMCLTGRDTSFYFNYYKESPSKGIFNYYEESPSAGIKETKLTPAILNGIRSIVIYNPMAEKYKTFNYKSNNSNSTNEPIETKVLNSYITSVWIIDIKEKHLTAFTSILPDDLPLNISIVKKSYNNYNYTEHNSADDNKEVEFEKIDNWINNLDIK